MVRLKRSTPISAVFRILVLFSIFRTSYTASTAVCAIDFGSEFMKIALVAPSHPMDIVLNGESQRKTLSNIGIKGQERFFSEAATSMHLKYPIKAYGFLVDLLGKKFDHPAVHLFHERFPYYLIEPDPDRGTILFRNDQSTYMVEELIGMLIGEALKYASNSAKQPVKDVVITVPFYFNQAERRAMIEAATIGGANVLQLMNDNAAAGINFGMMRRKEINETGMKIMIFDQGAWKTTATIYEYKMVKDSLSTNHPQMTVLGAGFDRNLGGLEVSLRLTNKWLKSFQESYDKKKTAGDDNAKFKRVADDPKIVRKLLKEANKIKLDLSTNSDRFVQIEDLSNNVDFKAQISRKQLEDLIADFPSRLDTVVNDALKMAGVDLTQLDYIVLMGGSTRMPKVQDSLQASVSGRELNRYLNTDEAIVMGAAYMAAHRCRGFKVKKFAVRDLNIYPIAVDFEREPSIDAPVLEDSNQPVIPISNENVPKIRRVLFKYKNNVPSKKKMTFSKHTHDFEFAINFDDLSHLSTEQQRSIGSLNISKVTIVGLSDNVEKVLKKAGTTYKGVKVHFRMDESNLLQLESADLAFETVITEDKNDSAASTLKRLGDKITSFFTSSNSDNEADMKNTTHNETNPDIQSTTEEPIQPGEPFEKKNLDSSSINQTEAEPGPPSSVPPQILQQNMPLKTEISFSDIKPISVEKMKEILARIKNFQTLEDQKAACAEEKHLLESSVIEIKMKISENDNMFITHCTAEKLEQLMKVVNDYDNWLEEDDGSTNIEEYSSRLNNLKSLTADIFGRIKETKERPKYVDELKTVLNRSRVFITGIKNLTTLPGFDNKTSIFTEVELSTLEKAIIETETWYQEITIVQSKLKPTDNPALTVQLLKEKITGLERELSYLLTKLKFYKPPKNPANETKQGQNETVIEDDEKPDVETDGKEATDESEPEKMNDNRDEKPEVETAETRHSEL